MADNLNRIDEYEQSNSDGRFQMDCAICLHKYVNPVQLPCNHIFCFLCVKGAANLNQRCAICRQDIPDDYFQNPCLLEKEDEIEIALFDDLYHWFYQGRNGWWLYDQRTSEDLEIAFKKGNKQCELLIAGNLYIIDFDQMMQYRRSEPNKRRRIKRDVRDSLVKGVSGIHITHDLPSSPCGDEETITPVTPTAPEEAHVFVNNQHHQQQPVLPSCNQQQQQQTIPHTVYPYHQLNQMQLNNNHHQPSSSSSSCSPPSLSSLNINGVRSNHSNGQLYGDLPTTRENYCRETLL